MSCVSCLLHNGQDSTPLRFCHMQDIHLIYYFPLQTKESKYVDVAAMSNNRYRNAILLVFVCVAFILNSSDAKELRKTQHNDNNEVAKSFEVCSTRSITTLPKKQICLVFIVRIFVSLIYIMRKSLTRIHSANILSLLKKTTYIYSGKSTTFKRRTQSKHST